MLIVHVRAALYDVYVGRASTYAPGSDGAWGNPFVADSLDGVDVASAAERHRHYLLSSPPL
eukprot:4779495-Pleurochrysis_carterae.AAC.1